MMQRYLFFTVVLSSGLSVAVMLALGWLWQDELGEWLQESSDGAALDTKVSVQDDAGTVIREAAPVADMVAAVNPAVVSIVATKHVPVYERVYDEYAPFGGWFGGSVTVPRLRESGTEEREVGGGSGFVVSEDGLIVTNRHVVRDTQANYTALFSSGESQPVQVLARDEVLDIAILQIATSTDRVWPYLQFGDSDDLRLGQTVVAIGNALAEFDNTISAGVVSGLSRSITARDRMGSAEQLDRVIQTDAAINPGNSGGPLLNLAGEVVGVNVAASLDAQNIGFALPINVVAQVVESVQETGEIVRPFLGVRYRPVTDMMVQENDLPVAYGVIVLRGNTPEQLAVVPGSPAARAGVQEGDIIFAVGDAELDTRSLASVLRESQVGDTVELRIWRNGAELTLSVTLAAAPAERE